YLPPGDGGMAHRSALSPDGKWVLVVEMDGAGWLPCRLLPFDGSSTGRRVGPQDGQCTTANWSKDGTWMFFSSNSGGFFHLWRQRFPDGKPEQITSGPTPTEEEGTTLTPDGRYLIASIGISLGSVWMHDKGEDRQLTSQGFAMLPSLSPDGKKIHYLLKAGASRAYISAELWEYDLSSGSRERALPGFLLSSYALSPDGQGVLFTVAEGEANSGIWIADLQRRAQPRRLTSGHEYRAFFGTDGEIIFLSDGETRYLYRMKDDGSQQTRISDAVINLVSVSPGGEWATVTIPKAGGRTGNIVQ